MKAITAVCPTTDATTVANNRRINRRRRNNNVHNDEIQMYISKLKDLVPFMPKNRKLSKLEVIQNVIDYICDLQTALESHPLVNGFSSTKSQSPATLNTSSTSPTITQHRKVLSQNCQNQIQQNQDNTTTSSTTNLTFPTSPCDVTSTLLRNKITTLIPVSFFYL